MTIDRAKWKAFGWELLDEKLDPHGIVGFGGPLNPERLIQAYELGVFPWPQEGMLVWFCPVHRGVLDFDRLHVPKRFRKDWRKTDFEFTKNQNFLEVMSACAQVPRRGQRGTWISPEMKEAYLELHRRGVAQSFEVWQSGRLVAGLYGVQSSRVFSGESAFGLVNNGAKYALLWCIQNLLQTGQSWMDIQMVTPLTEQFGGRYVSREEFLSRISVGPLI